MGEPRMEHESNTDFFEEIRSNMTLWYVFNPCFIRG